MKRIFLMVLSILICVSGISPQVLAESQGAPEKTETRTTVRDRDFYYTAYDTYNEYRNTWESAKDATKENVFSALDFDAEKSEQVSIEEYDGTKAIKIAENGALAVPVEVGESGFYNIILDYYPVSEGTSSIKMELYIDGEIPFYEASALTLKRVWKDADEKEYDSQGNEIRLPSKETPCWLQKSLTSSDGFTEEPFRFYLEEGTHTITVSVYQNAVALAAIRFTPPEQLAVYEKIAQTYDEQDFREAHLTKRIEAEDATTKSDRSIVIVNDTTSPATRPYSGTKIVYNSIGSGSWKTAGEWIEWEVDVPEDGLYTIVLRYKQDTKAGNVCYRSLYIDGEIPFLEARTLAFPYHGNWQTKTLGNEKQDYQFYLKKGVHTIRMEATLGDYSHVISKVSNVLTELNGIYTDILVVTGSNPDIDRDYQFEKSIPAVIEKMTVVSTRLKAIEKELELLTGEKGGENTAVIRRLSILLDKMHEEPETISKRLSNFMSDLSSLGTWINNCREQPLQLDYIMLSNSKEGTPKDNSSIFVWIKYYISQFWNSFFTDYANVGNKVADADKQITVWISAGRDQADIIRQLVNESFTPEYGIGVRVQLVDAGALTPATLADVGPDVYIGMAQNQPVEYALRHAVVNLSEFDDIDEVIKRFYPDSLTPLYLDDELYGLPDTMSYPMLFYRKDILTELGIKREDLLTWDSLLQTVLPELDMNHFDFGLTTGINSFGNFLYQNGGSFYNETNTASALDTVEGIAAFSAMTGLYVDYGLPLSFDFANRFRSGQMPLAVVDFTSYNQLSVFAPEIEGVWGMLPIPGIEDREGNVNNTAVCTVTSSAILKNSDYVEESWTFLKWWTDSYTQERYARELEAVMGTGARYATANKEAFQTIDWNRDIKMALEQQQKELVGTPSIAGGYYLAQNYDFAFRDVVYEGENLRETLANAAADITKEIENKRKEFYGNAH